MRDHAYRNIHQVAALVSVSTMNVNLKTNMVTTGRGAEAKPIRWLDSGAILECRAEGAQSEQLLIAAP